MSSSPQQGSREGLEPYAQERAVPALADCYFYHTVDLPGYGLVTGEWDLRDGVDDYLGHQPLAGKRVLEVGTASGFLCVEMERRGAEVVAYDLSDAMSWDIVPFAGADLQKKASDWAEHIRRLNNSWWLTQHATKSSARVIYGTVYEIPLAIGSVDVCTFGSVLLHVRDPLRALQSAARLSPQTIIVTDLLRRRRFGFLPERPSQRRSPLFVPNGKKKAPLETWWSFSPESVSNLLAIVGYRTTRTVRHAQRYRGRLMPMFTVVASRLDPARI